MRSSIRGKGKFSIKICLFNCLKSIQNLHVSSFLLTRQTRLAKRLRDSEMTPFSNMSVICFEISFFCTSEYVRGSHVMALTLSKCIRTGGTSAIFVIPKTI